MSRSILEYLDHILEETDFLLKEAEKISILMILLKMMSLSGPLSKALKLSVRQPKTFLRKSEISILTSNGEKWQECGINLYTHTLALTIKLYGLSYNRESHHLTSK